MELRLRRFAYHKRLFKLEQVLGNPGGRAFEALAYWPYLGFRGMSFDAFE